MSYCVHCGVELADYHEKCPLCGTEVTGVNVKIKPQTRDYPKYRENVKDPQTKPIRRFLAGTVLTLVFSMYIVIVLLIDLIINRHLSWSLIPVSSLIYLWFMLAFPLMRVNNSFFGLYTIDSFITAAYLLVLNLIISGDVHWAKFASAGIVFVWIMMNGIFISERVKRLIPMILYYVLASLLFTALFAFMLIDNVVIMRFVLPIYLATLFFTLLSFFIIKAMSFDIYNFFAVIFTNAALLSVVIDLVIMYYQTQTFALRWSLIVIAALVPLGLTALMLRNIKKLRSFVVKKFHR
ncbi:MAG: zinc ribbon domain-containing protein [Fidelibacterota bacterium]